jgi:hypothetical protein
MRPSLTIVMYTNFKDLHLKKLIFVKLHDPKLIHVWTQKRFDVMKDENDFKMFKVPRWVLMKRTNKLG